MQATQITLRNLRHSTALNTRIRELSWSLDRHHPLVQDCRVDIEQAELRLAKQHEYRVNVRVRIPGRELVANRNHDANLHVALRGAFDAIRRQLDDAAQIERHEVKHHEA